MAGKSVCLTELCFVVSGALLPVFPAAPRPGRCRWHLWSSEGSGVPSVVGSISRGPGLSLPGSQTREDCTWWMVSGGNHGVLATVYLAPRDPSTPCILYEASWAFTGGSP